MTAQGTAAVSARVAEWNTVPSMVSEFVAEASRRWFAAREEWFRQLIESTSEQHRWRLHVIDDGRDLTTYDITDGKWVIAAPAPTVASWIGPPP